MDQWVDPKYIVCSWARYVLLVLSEMRDLVFVVTFA